MFALLRQRRFGPFFWTQLLGALNDNVFRNALVVLFAFRRAAAGLPPDTLVNLSTALFIAPFFLFSASAGELADRIDKARLVRFVKLLEIGITAAGAVALQVGSVGLLLAVLFLMGAHSTLFGPVKYSILPQHLRAEELVGGNALVQLGTFVAILAGTTVGGLLASLPRAEASVAAVVLAIAVAGWLASRGIPPAPATDVGGHVGLDPVRETRRTLALAREDPTVFVSILAISWFWFYGALLLAQLPGLIRDALAGSEAVVTLLLAVFAVGVALGCVLCDRLSAGRIDLGLVAPGAVGMSLFALDLFLATRGAPARAGPVGALAFVRAPQAWRVMADVLLIAAAGGFFIVPLQALVQERTAPERRSRVIAAGNVVSALFMVVAAMLAIGLRRAGATIPQLVLLLAVLNAVAAVCLRGRLP